MQKIIHKLPKHFGNFELRTANLDPVKTRLDIWLQIFTVYDIFEMYSLLADSF